MLSLLVVLLSACNTVAWWADGHMLTAQIAYNQLSSTSKQAANNLIQLLASDYPTSPDFVTAACWADDIKSQGVTQYNNWHFVDLPVVRGGFWWNVPSITNSSINPWAIHAAVQTIATSNAAKLDKAIQLRFLIHFVGDIHQPLHAASMFSPEFKTGDQGGNLWKIKGVNETNLHSWWDSGGELWADDLPRPLTADGKQWLANWVSIITQTYPPSAFSNQLSTTDVYAWGVESNAVADTVAYTAPNPINQAYTELTRDTCMQQVALGGYRLAQVIESLFNKSSPIFGIFAQESEKYLVELYKDQPAQALRGGRN